MPLTILAPTGRQRPSKAFFRNDNGEIEQKAYPNVKHFSCETRPVNCLDDLYKELAQIEHGQQALVIRGGLTQDVDLSKHVLRRIKREAQQTSTKGVLEILCQFFNVQHNAVRRIDYDREYLPINSIKYLLPLPG